MADAGVSRATFMITYIFPLRRNVLASLQLPSDLSRKEAQRLGACIESLALDDVPALPPHAAATKEDDRDE